MHTVTHSVFGPDGKLHLPSSNLTGEVRAYDASLDGSYTTFIPPLSPAIIDFAFFTGLAFGSTAPDTLAYGKGSDGNNDKCNKRRPPPPPVYTKAPPPPPPKYGKVPPPYKR